MRALTVIMGDSEFLVDQEYRHVLEQVASDGRPVEEVDPSDDAAVMDALDTASLFGGGRVVVLKGDSRSMDRISEKLAGFAENPTPDTSVVVVTGSGKKLAKSLGSRGEIIEIAGPKPWDTAAWLMKYVKGSGRQINSDAAELMVETLGTDLRDLAGALDTLALSTKGKIDAATVARHFSGQGTAIYTFLEAVLQRDRAGALKHLHALTRAGDHPLVLHASLVKQFRALAAIHGLERRDQPSARELDVAQGYMNRANKHGRRFLPEDIRRALVSLSETDLALKGGLDGEDAPAELIIELLVVELTARRQEFARR